MSAMRDDNRRLNQAVSELRTERRAQERKLRDLQRQIDLARANQVAAVVPNMPQLPVEVVAPDKVVPANGPRVVGVTENGEEIVYEGDAALGKVAISDDPPPAPAPTRVARPTPQRTAPIAARTSRTPTRETPTDRGGDAAADYRAAVELVKSGQHEQAVTSLRAFIQKYSRHDYADNAQYWLGESFYARKEYQQALVEFRNVIETYPRGNKVPDALLKVGYCYQSLGQTDKARAVLEQVVSLYPKTEPAALAAKRLETP